MVFDSAKKTFRDDLFEEYKANRAEMPSDLAVQIPYIHRAVDAFGIRTLVVEGYEADDVIGTLAVRASRNGFDVVIVTADKDFMQLVGPHVELWDTMRDRRIGPAQVRERFGIEPAAVVDLMALMGDTIDNVKGVPGIGEKTAAALIRHFGSLENLFAGLDRIEQSGIRGARRIGELIARHRNDVELARKLVRIDTNLKLDLDLNDLRPAGIDQKAAAQLFRELEFGSLLNELAPAEANIPLATETTVDAVRAREAISAIRAAPRFALSLRVDNDGTERLRLGADGDARTFVFASPVFEMTRDLLEASNPPRSCHDLKSHIRRLNRHSIRLAGVDFDTMLAGFLVNPGKPEPSIADLYHEHLAPTVAGEGIAASEPHIIEALRRILLDKLEEASQTRLLIEIELPIARILAEMEETGIGVDSAALRELAIELGESVARLEGECYRLAGHSFNLNSPTQLRRVLFDELKLPIKGLGKTRSGPSTDVDTLTRLAEIHPLPRTLLEYRSLAKLKSTYADTLPELVNPATGRIHTSFHQALTATGRLSSSDPNLQNIPTRSEAGRRIRRAFAAAPGNLLLSADYSQIELRVLAHMSGDETLIDAFMRGEDIHVRTATEILGIRPESVDLAARRLAKVINFGLIYGMGANRLAAELGIGIAEASDYIKRYFERMPGVKAWFDRCLVEARERGWVATMYGRRRYLPALSANHGGARAQAERIAINTPLQGTAADLMKLAMIRLHDAIHGSSARMVLQVHDELLLEVGRDDLASTREVCREAMEHVAALKVPLVVDLKWGPNWAELNSAA
jgi:DNA polymerase-1